MASMDRPWVRQSDGTGLCLFTKRLEHGVFLWPPSVDPSETLSLTSTQLSLLIEAVDWRTHHEGWKRCDSASPAAPIQSGAVIGVRSTITY